MIVSAPVISGDIRINSILSSTQGVWLFSPITYLYQWKRNGIAISGETASTYTVVASDIDAEITCEVTAINGTGSSLPQDSNTLTSPWRDILIARSSTLIFDINDPYCCGGASIGSPVENIYTVNGILIGTQAISSLQATRTANGLAFDGIDDRYICNNHANMTEQQHTMVWGFDNPEDTTTTVRTLFCASASSSATTTRQTSVNYSRPSSPNATRQRYYISEAASISTSLQGYSIGAGPYDMVLRAGASGGSMRAARLNATLTSISSNTRSADDGIAYKWCYIGCRAVSATPNLAQYWQGDIRHFAIDNTEWSDTDTQIYRSCAIAAGVMV